jgi:hypothetical protein
MEPTPKLNAAIAAVMAEVVRLQKADENKFGHYNYTSVDDFKDALRPLLAKHGLTIHLTEAGPVETVEQERKTVGGKDAALIAKYVFSITLEHVDGEVGKEEKITVMLPYTGAQTSGAARSYAVKEWGKSRFLMSSGDTDDADTMKQEEYGGAVLSKKDAKPLYEALQKEMREIVTERNSGALMQWGVENRQNMFKLPHDWLKIMRAEYAMELGTLKAAERADTSNGAHHED